MEIFACKQIAYGNIPIYIYKLPYVSIWEYSDMYQYCNIPICGYMVLFQYTNIWEYFHMLIYGSFIHMRIFSYAYIWVYSHMFVCWNKTIYSHMGMSKYWYIWEYSHILPYGSYYIYENIPICYLLTSESSHMLGLWHMGTVPYNVHMGQVLSHITKNMELFHYRC